jgi:hypothetical protein
LISILCHKETTQRILIIVELIREPENMTGKVLNRGSSSALVLILPIALIVVLVLKAWLYLILLFIVLTLGNLWQTYRWKQQCQQVDPSFFALITEQQGYLTPIDLAVKANLSATTAENFLAKKAEEYGAQSKKINNKVAGYYFITTNALKSIFEESEPPLETDEIELSLASQAFTVESVPSTTTLDDPVSEPGSLSELESDLDDLVSEPGSLSEPELDLDVPVSEPGSLSELESDLDVPVSEPGSLSEPELDLDVPVSEPGSLSEPESDLDVPVSEPGSLSESKLDLETSSHQEQEANSDDKPLPLTQAELAKRLKTNSNTIRKKRTTSDFSSWTQSLDPEGVAWKYSPQDNSPKNILFEPLMNETESK